MIFHLDTGNENVHNQKQPKSTQIYLQPHMGYVSWRDLVREFKKKPDFRRFPGKSQNKLGSQQNTLLVHALEQYMKILNLSLSL